MKSILYLFCCLIIVSCQKTKTTKIPKGDFDYLIGNWERTNEQEGKETFEVWEQTTKNSYQGIGYTLQNKDTVWKEQMRLIQRDTTWVLEIHNGVEPMVPFTVLKKTASSFLAHNPSNEFPTHIQYRYFDDTITAVVSSKEMEIPFVFWRVEE
ncbi:hypothetical protein [uncultured Dokdonia sp.]|uniref:hypothetical protein n=1 Tax=uncultured Dokdonia sp. TaxID=575653 RepID=UPI002631E4EC|nr:hypothetical protein [uncultured Dokdonia sp.]